MSANLKNDKICGTVYETKDYARFQTLEGNRDVLKQRKEKIKRSIQEYGLIYNPIVVNEHFEIIDGQGRFEACRELGLPIRYSIGSGLRLKECIALNAATTNWSTMDYIESGCSQNLPSFLRLRDLIQKHRAIPLAAVINITKRTYGGGASAFKQGSVMSHIKNGDYEFPQADAERADKTLDFIEKMLANVQINGPTQYFAQAVAFICEKTDADQDRLLRKWQSYASRQSSAKRFGTICDAISSLTYVYNYKVRPAEVKYLDNDYDLYCRNANAAYPSRWGRNKNHSQQQLKIDA